MDFKSFKEKKSLSYAELGKFFGFSKAKAYQLCQPDPPRVCLTDALHIVAKSDDCIKLKDLIPGGN
jgi:UDP-N-acetylglucosamine pyrophosphorylase